MDYFETHNGYNKDIKYLEKCKFVELGESTPCLLKIVVTNRKKLHLVFLGTCGHHILDNFCSFQVYIALYLNLNYYILKENSTNIYELEHMKYICVKINMSHNMQICKYTSKQTLWVEFCSELFCGEWYWYTSTKFHLEVKKIWLKIYSKNVFFGFFKNNECIINSFFGEKSLP